MTMMKARRGGRRPGAGRPPKGDRAGSPHKKRQAFRSSTPIHVVLRATADVIAALGTLRSEAVYRAVRTATIVLGKREDVRIVHLSIQRTHLHLLVEAEHRLALAAGMKAFQISAAKQINRLLQTGAERRRGQVFADRYHTDLVATPRDAHYVLGYVINNWRKHGEDRAEPAWRIDPFSTAAQLWPELERVEPAYEPLAVWAPRTWLLAEGWREHGPISYLDAPRPPA